MQVAQEPAPHSPDTRAVPNEVTGIESSGYSVVIHPLGSLWVLDISIYKCAKFSQGDIQSATEESRDLMEIFQLILLLIRFNIPRRTIMLDIKQTHINCVAN